MDTSANFSNSSIIPPIFLCSKSRPTSVIFIPWFIVYVLFLPVFISVPYIGYQRWRNKRSVSMAATHSDVMTFHMVALEMVNIVGSCLYCWDLFTGTTILGIVGTGMTIMVSYGQVFFHLLTCVDRYLAVVHPITYQGLKQVGGVRIRNLSIGCVWLFSCGMSIIINVLGAHVQSSSILDLLFLFLCAALISFCSFSVLCVLIRPGPGEVGGDRKVTNKSMRRALNTMMSILGALLLKFISNLIVSISFFLVKVIDVVCAILLSSHWFNLPSSLVLPLLFLHRVRKRPGKQKTIKKESI